MAEVAKPCMVKVLKLQEERDYKKENICPTVKLTKEEKALVLDKKKQKPKKEPKTPKTKKKDKNGKFQMKITGFFSPPGAGKKVEKEEEEEDSEDSGVASRADSPEDDTPKKEEEEKDADEEIADEKKKFLEDLEESEDEEESEEEDESSEEDSEDDFDPNGDSDDDKKGFAKKTAAKKKPAPAKRAPPAKGSKGPTIITSELSAYEKIREGNIKEREAMLAALQADFEELKRDAGIGRKVEKKPAKKRKRVEYDSDGDEVGFSSVRVEGSRKSARISQKPEDREKLGSEVTYKDPPARGLAEEQDGYDSDDYQAYEDRTKKRAPRPGQIDPNENVLMPEDVTKAMLNKVCERFGEKTYNQTIGTTCHQCRQKTTDTKTICRSGKCVGVRGQFCGRCIAIRYGEDCKEALLNPTWSCPPCRGFCNCSICRNRNGKGATGILHHLAQSKGFDDVASYLKSLTAKKGTDEFDETDDEGEEKPEKPKKKKKGKKGKKKKAKAKKEEAGDEADEDGEKAEEGEVKGEGVVKEEEEKEVKEEDVKEEEESSKEDEENKENEEPENKENEKPTED